MLGYQIQISDIYIVMSAPRQRKTKRGKKERNELNGMGWDGNTSVESGSREASMTVPDRSMSGTGEDSAGDGADRD